MLGEGVEATIAENGAEAREIVGEGIEHAEPILAIVDFEALKGSEPIVGLNEACGIRTHGLAVGSGTLHALRESERLHNRAGHGALEFE
jgi:hypothetical protein